MNDMNCVTISGRLADAPRINTTGRGYAIGHAVLEVHETRYQQDAEGQRVALDAVNGFYRVKVTGRDAIEALQCARQGDRLMVCGRLTVNVWNDQNGVRRSEVEIDARIVLLAVPPSQMANAEAPAAPAPQPVQGATTY